MDFFGLTDPWNIGAYVGCILCVAFCIAYGIRKSADDETDETEGEDGN